MPRLLWLLVSLVALVAPAGGCGRKAPGGPATVRGAVTFQGRPLAGGLVVFSPDPERGGSGKPARGDLGPDGTFALALGGEPAIPPGWYRVAIAPAPASVLDPSDRPAFPAKLARPDQSGLLREVKPGQENVFDFAVEVPGG